MKENVSLVWLDWKLAGRMTGVQSLGRFLFLFLLAFAFLSLLLSGGIARFLSANYRITAMLRDSVSQEEAIGLAKRIAALSSVASAEYRDPASSWKEFLQAYPGIESIPGAGTNPLPGYIEIRIRHDLFTAAGVQTVISALKPVQAVDKVLAGEESLPGLLKAERALGILSTAGLAVLALLFFLICRLQDRLRWIALAGDIAFLRERGVEEGQVAACRAGGAAVTGALLATAAVVSAAAALHSLLARHPPLAGVVGPPEELLSPPAAMAAAAFVLFSAALFAGASLLGRTPLRPAGDR